MSLRLLAVALLAAGLGAGAFGPSPARAATATATAPAPATEALQVPRVDYRERKLGNLRATEADLIAAGNIGCITQLSGSGLQVVHTVELLAWMAGGPMPPGLQRKHDRCQ